MARQGQRKQDEKRPEALGRQAVNKEASRHVSWSGPPWNKTRLAVVA